MIKPSDPWAADSSSWNSFHAKSLQARNCKGSGLLSYWRWCFDSWAGANHIVRSHKLIWVSALTLQHVPVSLLSWSTRYCYLFISLITRESLWTSNKHENVYLPDFIERVYEHSRNAKRALRKLARETHAPMERLGSKRNQYGGRLLTRKNTCVVNWS